MTKEQLEAGTQISRRLTELNATLHDINTSKERIRFTQNNLFGGGLSIEVFPEPSTELGRQMRAVLLATKQTLKSMIELEIEKLTKELEGL